LYQHFKAVNDAIGIPILIYNIPPRSVVDMSVDTMKRLSELANIVGVKHAMGPDFIQLSGEDMTALAAMAAGGHGCISVTANIAPAPCAELMEATFKGDWDHALKIQDRLTPLHAAIFAEPGVNGAKYALSLLGRARAETRLPLLPVSEATEALIRRAMVHAGLLHACGSVRVPAATERPNFKVAADNRRARLDYEIGATFEAGLMLTGPEVKSLRNGKATVAESYAAVDRNGEVMLYNANIPEYLQANRFNHEPKRARKLLL